MAMDSNGSSDTTTDNLLLTDVEPAPPPRLDAPVAEQEPRPFRKGGRGLAGILAVSLASAVFASGGTVAMLGGSLANSPAATSSTANGRTVTTIEAPDDITAVVAAARRQCQPW